MEKKVIRVSVFLIVLLLIMPIAFAQKMSDEDEKKVISITKIIKSIAGKITGSTITGYTAEEGKTTTEPETQEEQTETEVSEEESEEPQESVEEQPEETATKSEGATEESERVEEEKEYFGEEEIPEGCHKITTESGMFQIECSFDKEGFEDFDLKEEMENCDGKFEMIEGKPVCIKKGRVGFGSTECPTQEELDNIATKCEGKVEYFTDESGCSAVMCINEKFKKEFDNRLRKKYDNELQRQAIECKKDGGKFVLIKGEPKCIKGVQETIMIKRDLGTITEKDIKNAGSKLDMLESKLEAITSKLEGKQGEVFDEATKRLKAIQKKIEDIKTKLATDSNLTKEERIEIIAEMKAIQKTLSDVTIGIVNGKMPTEEDIHEEMFEQFEEFYGGPFKSKEELEQWAKKERDTLEIVRNCDKYESVESFAPPDPEGMVVKVELQAIDGGRCQMKIHTAKGGIATYLIPPEIYTTFRGPEDLIKENIPCTGACEFMEKMMTEPHGPGENPEAEACMEECIRKDCDNGLFECMLENKEKCEKECGFGKREMEGPPGMENMGEEERCIMECVGPDVMCKSGPEGEENPKCKECAEKCAKEFYKGPCLNDEQLKEKEKECESKCEHCYGKPIMGDSGDGRECIIGMECKDASSEFGDEAGEGPANFEEGHGPGEEFGPPEEEIAPMTGEVVSGENQGFFSKIVNWFKSLFGGDKSSKSEISSGDSVDDITEDLSKIQKDLGDVSENIG